MLWSGGILSHIGRLENLKKELQMKDMAKKKPLRFSTAATGGLEGICSINTEIHRFIKISGLINLTRAQSYFLRCLSWLNLPESFLHACKMLFPKTSYNCSYKGLKWTRSLFFCSSQCLFLSHKTGLNQNYSPLSSQLTSN